MDLRNRYNLELLQVEGLSELKSLDSDLNSALYSECNLSEEVRTKAACYRSWKIVPLRMHVFHQLVKNQVSVRIVGDVEGHYMSDFVSEIVVQTDSGEKIAWKREAEKDGLSFSREILKKIEIAISIDYENSLLPVPEALGSDLVYADFINLFKIICEYIRLKNLSSNDDPSYFTPDEVLHALLYPNLPESHPVSFASLLDAVRTHIKPPGPFKISHSIEPSQNEQIFEIMVQVAENRITHPETNLLQFRQASEPADKAIAQSTENVAKVHAECEFLDKLIENPVGFLKNILLNPTGCAKQIESSGKIDFAQLTTSYDFYKQPWAVAAAAHVVNEQRKSADKRYI